MPGDLQVQRQIAETLKKYDSYVEEKEDRSRQLARWESVLFERMFGRELRFHDRLPLKEYLREMPCVGPAKTEVMENDGIPEKYRVTKGDILIHNGNVRLGAGEGEEYFDRNVLCVRTDPGQLLPQVLAAWLKQPAIQKILYTEKKPGDSPETPHPGPASWKSWKFRTLRWNGRGILPPVGKNLRKFRSWRSAWPVWAGPCLRK